MEGHACSRHFTLVATKTERGDGCDLFTRESSSLTVPISPQNASLGGKDKLEGMESRYGRFQEPREAHEGCPGSGRVNVAQKESRIAETLRCPHLRIGVIHSTKSWYS